MQIADIVRAEQIILPAHIGIAPPLTAGGSGPGRGDATIVAGFGVFAIGGSHALTIHTIIGFTFNIESCSADVTDPDIVAASST